MADLIKSCLGDDTIKIKALPTIRSTLARLSQTWVVCTGVSQINAKRTAPWIAAVF